MSVRFPYDLMEQEFASPVSGKPFVTNHCSYMIALAMMEGVETIGLWGCQYAGHERAAQRESLYYWLGRYEQWGGKIIIPKRGNDLFLMPMYGYESHDEQGNLVDAYKPAAFAKKAPDVKGKLIEAQMHEVKPDVAEGRIPLMQLPKGEEPAWERSLHKVKDNGELILVGAK